MSERPISPTPQKRPWQLDGEQLLPQSVQHAINEQMMHFGEMPDRTSPDDFPEGYVLTRQEIVRGMLNVIEADRAARDTPSETAYGWRKPTSNEPVWDEPVLAFSHNGGMRVAVLTPIGWREIETMTPMTVAWWCRLPEVPK